MAEPRLGELQKEARRIIDSVAGDPQARYRLREQFYRKHGGVPGSEFGMGTSELAFMRWELGRGVLDPDKGSRWWRNVNTALIYFSTLADLIREAKIDPATLEGLEWPARFWLNFFDQPTAANWYRAHNSSVIAGYLAHVDDAQKEDQPEQLFMNIVLYRVLYAQAMVEGAAYAFGPLGRVLANPPNPAVEALVDLPDFYPDHYPMSKDDIQDVLKRGHALQEVGVLLLDDGLIIPHLRELYASASGWNVAPGLELLLQKGQPIYPGQAKRKKIAILGGGVGAITTAFALTDPKNTEGEQVDVTIYQIGWRIGGKGASGRSMDPEQAYRIHEHGLHVWFGCYDNAFRVMREAYDELAQPSLLTGDPLRAPDAPLANWRQAFRPHDSAIPSGRYDRIWHSWFRNMPTNNAVPGSGDLLSLGEYFRMGLELLFDQLRARPLPGLEASGDLDIQPPAKIAAVLAELASRVETTAWEALRDFISGNHFMAKMIDRGGAIAMKLVGNLMAAEWADAREKIKNDVNVETRWVMLNYFYAQLKGFFVDRLAEKGINSINHLEYRQWLGKHAFDDGGLMVNSSFVQTIYDGSFAYVDGDNTMPPGHAFPPKANMEAGTTLRAGLRMMFGFKGSPLWKMQAGMGDVVFGPFYQVLRRRGVKFKFFHRVREIVPNADNTAIESIRIGIQATLKHDQELAGGYDPLFNVKGLPCWPATPLYDQLVEGDELRAKGIDLESYSADWPDRDAITLRAGEDFDAVVMGISLGAVPYLCGPLIKASPAWRDMVQNIKTIRTQGVQLWLKKTTSQLGWGSMEQPVLSGVDYRGAPNPLETWADMTHLIDREAWPNRQYPMSIAYFCSSLSDSDQTDQAKVNFEVREHARTFLKKHIFALLPRCRSRDGKDFDWDLLVDPRPNAPVGEARLDSQFFIGNVKPSERYVLTAAGTSKYRLPAHDRQFLNLYLSGDWIENHLNYGCVEAAVMGGLYASNALCGYPKKDDIFGLAW